MQFFNREEERTRITEIISKIQKGTSKCVWVEGESGAGKSFFVKYLLDNSTLPIFTFEDSSYLHKCNKVDMNIDYNYIIQIANKFLSEKPKQFNDFLTKYFANMYDLSWLEALALLIPSIKVTKWATDLVQQPLQKIESSKDALSNRMYESGLKKCLAELIIYMIKKVYKQDEIVFCIDDASWLDKKSIDALRMLLNITKVKKEKSIGISFILTTRTQKELVNDSENYFLLESNLKDIFEEIDYFYICNFNFSITREYIKSSGREFLDKTIRNIYEITCGNPQELYQTLKFDEKKLIDIVTNTKISSIDGKRNSISVELLLDLQKKNPYVIPILSCIAGIGNVVETSLLLKQIQNISNVILEFKFENKIYESGIELLIEKEFLSKDRNYFKITHDSVKEITINYLEYSGEYGKYMDCIVGILKTLDDANDKYTETIFRLLNEYNSYNCFEQFKIYKDTHLVLDNNIIRFVAESIIKDLRIFTENNLNKFIVPIILKECVFHSLFDQVYKISKLIYPVMDILTFGNQMIYLNNFIKVLIDKGYLTSDKEFNAITLIEQLLSINNLSSEDKMNACILSMSAYEHILDFENIARYNDMAKLIREKQKISNYNSSLYLRNQGLIKSHRSLIDTYIESISFADLIDNKREKMLMLGTCKNNLGLSYFYSGNTGKALEEFILAQKYLEKIGYDTFRVLNNIAICHLMQNNLPMANEYILMAKSINFNCIFESLCIESNLALIEWKLGHYLYAQELVQGIINEYNSNTKQTNDDLVYCSAMVNAGYFYFCEENYIEASKLFKDSLFFNYRYDNELQEKKRRHLLNLSLEKIGVILNSETDLDIGDKNLNIFTKMYAPILFAYYII